MYYINTYCIYIYIYIHIVSEPQKTNRQQWTNMGYSVTSDNGMYPTTMPKDGNKTISILGIRAVFKNNTTEVMRFLWDVDSGGTGFFPRVLTD